MTREEAIEFGKMWLELHEDCKESYTYEFFKMAIKELGQELCKDAVSRKEVKKIAKEMYLEVANMELDVSTISDCISYTSSKYREVLESKLQALPSVKKQEPRKGHWKHIQYEETLCCSECGCRLFDEQTYIPLHYCPNCGADMREGKE